MVPFIVAAVFITIAYWTRSTFLQIMAGLVSIAAGIFWISTDPDHWIDVTIGVAILLVGVYELIMVGVDLWKER